MTELLIWPLTLPEELLLLALHDTKGSITANASTAIEYALAGGQLIELAVAERISLESKHVAVTDAAPFGDELIDAALVRIAAEAKARTAKWWVNALHGKTKARYLSRLRARGVVSTEHHRMLGILPVTRHPQTDPAVEQEIRARLRHVLLEGGQPDERTVGLVGLVSACNLVGVAIPDRAERKNAKAQIKSITEGRPVGTAVKAIVDEINAAVMITVMAASSVAYV